LPLDPVAKVTSERRVMTSTAGAFDVADVCVSTLTMPNHDGFVDTTTSTNLYADLDPKPNLTRPVN